jgi:hypothetical protein
MLLLVSWPSAAAAFAAPSTVSTRSTGRTTVLHGLTMSGGGGFGEKPKPKVPKPSSALLRWGEANGVDYGGSLSVKEFDGIRGVAADEALVPGTRVLAVPAALALQVTTNQPAPSWADKELWRSSTWYVRLALRLLHEKGKGASSELAPWVEQLPASFDTPFFWNEEELEALAYRPLQQAVEKQRTEWAAIARKLPSAKVWGGSKLLAVLERWLVC